MRLTDPIKGQYWQTHKHIHRGNHVSSGTRRRSEEERYGCFWDATQRKSVLVPALEIRGACCNQWQKYRGEKKKATWKQIPWRQLSAGANNQFVLCWLQANHGLNTDFRSVSSLLRHVMSNLQQEENEINAFHLLRSFPGVLRLIIFTVCN